MNAYTITQAQRQTLLDAADRDFNESIHELLSGLPVAAPRTIPLTDIDIAAAIEVADAKWADANVPLGWAKHFARAIEAAHKIGAKT